MGLGSLLLLSIRKNTKIRFIEVRAGSVWAMVSLLFHGFQILKPMLRFKKYGPFWVVFPALPLEYRDLDLIEMLANMIGIFIKHDLIPFKLTHLRA